MSRLRIGSGLALALCLAACVGPKEPPPAPAPEPVRAVPTPSPAAPLPPPSAVQDWADLPLTPGEWRYREAEGGPEAVYATAGGGFLLRCERGRRQVSLARLDVAAGPLAVRTSTIARTLEAGSPLAATDALLDAMVFSRGRFTVSTPGAAMLVIPAWPEPARVLEECRG